MHFELEGVYCFAETKVVISDPQFVKIKQFTDTVRSIIGATIIAIEVASSLG